MIGSSRINKEDMCCWAVGLQCMTSFEVIFNVLCLVILPCASRCNSVMFLKSHFINLSSHAGAIWMKAPSTVGTKGLPFAILLASLRTWRLIWLLFFYRILLLFIPFIICYLSSSCNKCLIFGRSNDPHLDKLVMLLSERFNERVKSRHLLVSSR